MYNNYNHTQRSKEPARMHINPHFKQRASVSAAPHINPNFYQALSADGGIIPQVQNIHFNPRFVNVSNIIHDRGAQTSSVDNVTTVPTNKYSGAVQTQMTVPTPAQCSRSKYKLVNVNSREIVNKSTSSRESCSHSEANYSSNPNLAMKNIVVMKSKYKLVRDKSQSVAAAPSQKKTVKINKYKLVSIENIAPKNTVKERVCPRIPIAATVNNVNRKIDRRKKLTIKPKFNTSFKVNNKKGNSSLITIRGQKFTATGKSLRLVGKSDSGLKPTNKILIRVNGKTYQQKSQSLFIRRNDVSRRNLKKNNIPCPQYRKYGRCLRYEKEKCPLLHDKKYVVVCPKFLKGQCQTEDCLLSHIVSAKKMPTCSFYLQGCCVRELCPYLHVKLSDSTSVCEDFVKGYCERGEQCVLRHVFVCPQYAKDGKCPRASCPYPHKKRVCKTELTIINKEIIQTNKRDSIIQQNKTKDDQSSDPNRYYVCGKTDEDDETKEIHTSRCQLGTLPAFIKL